MKTKTKAKKTKNIAKYTIFFVFFGEDFCGKPIGGCLIGVEATGVMTVLFFFFDLWL